jgi:Fe2+ transport system protein B
MRMRKMAPKKSGKKRKIAERTPSELLDEYEELKHELHMAEHALNMLAQKHDEMREEFFAMNGAQLREVTDRWQAAKEEYQTVVVDRVDRMEGIFRAKQRPFKQQIRELSEKIAKHPGQFVDADEEFF